MEIEHYVHKDGQTEKVEKVAFPKQDGSFIMTPIGHRTHDNFTHHLFLIQEEWIYKFCIWTIIAPATPGYQAFVWCPTLTDLLDYAAKYLPPEKRKTWFIRQIERLKLRTAPVPERVDNFLAV